jgi:MFS family permease
VASLYYAQPMLGVLGADIGASGRAVGFIPTLTQLGYALGILLLAPLGDRFDRRRIVLIKAAALCAALLVAGAAPSIGVLLAASLAIGLAATMAQDIVPAAATLAPEASRGKTVGTVMTGLLLGILLSRVVSGFVAEHFGWRAMFIAAAASIALIGAAAWRGLPRFRPDHAPGLRRAARLAGHAVVAPRHAAPRGTGTGAAGGGLQRVLVDAGGDAAWRALPPGERRGRRLRAGRCGGCARGAAGRAAGRPARPATGDAPGRRTGRGVVRRHGARAADAAARAALAAGHSGRRLRPGPAGRR